MTPMALQATPRRLLAARGPALRSQRHLCGPAAALGRCRAPWRAKRQLTCARSGGRGPRDQEEFFRRARSAYQQRSGGRDPFSNVKISETSLVEYALPAAALLVVSMVAAPLLGGLVFAALGLGAATALFTLSWAFLPLVLGGGLLFGGAMFAGLFGGLLFINLIKFGALGAALWLGAKFAQSVFGVDGGSSAGSGSSSRGKGSRGPVFNSTGTIDVDAETLDDDWDREQQRREEELREFDDLLRRREQFKSGGRDRTGL